MALDSHNPCLQTIVSATVTINLATSGANNPGKPSQSSTGGGGGGGAIGLWFVLLALIHRLRGLALLRRYIDLYMTVRRHTSKGKF